MGKPTEYFGEEYSKQREKSILKDRIVNSIISSKARKKTMGLKRCYYDWLDHGGKVDNIGRRQIIEHCLCCVKVFRLFCEGQPIFHTRRNP